jgi:hypothetical protein
MSARHSAAPSGAARKLSFPALALAICSFVFFARSAHAAPKDAQAQKALKQAMEEDYLDTKFDEAEEKLRKAIETCGDSGCAKPVKAKLYIALGIILGGGKQKKTDARNAFVEALKLDKKAAPDPDYVTSEIKTIFEEAQKKAGSGGGTSEPPPEDEGPLTVSPIPQQKVNTPVPIYVALDDDTAKEVTSVVVKYLGTGASSPKELKLERSGKAYKGNVPCNSVRKKGTLSYWVVAKDRKDKEVATAGTEESPLTTEIVDEVDGKAPSWPGFAPPEQCKGGGGGGDDTSGSSKRQCIDDKDCPTGEQCSSNECLRKPGEGTDGGGDLQPGDGDAGSDDGRKNWITLTFAPDFTIISGDDICGFKDGYTGDTPSEAFNPAFVCAKNPDAENPERYLGQPTPGQGNNVNTGFGVSTMRLTLGYDRVIIAGFSLGARVGYVFNGTNEDFASFIPVHAEARAAYTFGNSPWKDQVVRPWIFLSGGFAQVDTAVEVDVLEDGEACGAADPGDNASECTVESESGEIEPRIQTVRAIQQAGLGFAGGGAGVSFVPVGLFEINLGLKFSVTFPVVVPVISPEVGIGFGF